MTTEEMLANLRTLLDEDQEQFWTDIECYAALSNGQAAYTNLILSVFKIRQGEVPEVLLNLITGAGGTTDDLGEIALPSNFMHLLSSKLNSVACSIIPFDRSYYFRTANSYLAGTTTSPTVAVINTYTGIALKFSSIDTDVFYYYLKNPPDITDSIDAILLQESHTAIVLYAFAEVLKKARRTEESSKNMNDFINLVQRA